MKNPTKISLPNHGKTVFEQSLVKSMSMTDGIWQRHANPWSVWTRMSCLPLIVLAIWSREWIGEWSLLALGLALLWTWLNPRVFPPPKSFDHWPAKATFGERIWLNRGSIPIPLHHQRAALITSLLTIPGLVAMGYGLYNFELWPTILGTAFAVIAKLWFCDRMVWLYEDMSRINPVYASWANRPVNDNDQRKAAS